MRSEEALAGFRRLQNHFKARAYKGAELNPIWPDLLPLSLAAFERAIGIIMKNGKFLPEAGYVLEQTRHWQKRMAQEQVSKGASAIDVDAMAKESTRLTRGYLEGTLPLEEYIAGLYLLSEKTGCVEYAELARRKERKLRGEHHGG